MAPDYLVREQGDGLYQLAGRIRCALAVFDQHLRSPPQLRSLRATTWSDTWTAWTTCRCQITSKGSLTEKPEFQRIDHEGAYGSSKVARLSADVRLRPPPDQGRLLRHVRFDRRPGRSAARPPGGLRPGGEHDRNLHVRPRRDAGRPRHLLEGAIHVRVRPIRVPFIVSWPGHIPEGVRSSALDRTFRHRPHHPGRLRTSPTRRACRQSPSGRS